MNNNKNNAVKVWLDERINTLMKLDGKARDLAQEGKGSNEDVIRAYIRLCEAIEVDRIIDHITNYPPYFELYVEMRKLQLSLYAKEKDNSDYPDIRLNELEIIEENLNQLLK